MYLQMSQTAAVLVRLQPSADIPLSSSDLSQSLCKRWLPLVVHKSGTGIIALTAIALTLLLLYIYFKQLNLPPPPRDY